MAKFKSIYFIALLSLMACKDTYEVTSYIPQEMKPYFVDFQPGTYWIFRDSIDTNYYDTLVLVQKERVDRVAEELSRFSKKTEAREGMQLHYQSTKKRNIYVYVGSGPRNSSARFDPRPSPRGELRFEYIDLNWSANIIKQDSLWIEGVPYHDVLSSHGFNHQINWVSVAKHSGIIQLAGTDSEGTYRFLNVIEVVKP